MLKKIYKKYTSGHYPRLQMLWLSHGQKVRYIIAGGTATFVDIALLYIFIDVFGMWHIAAAVLAFILAFVVSLLLQKYWTFKNFDSTRLHAQVSLYLLTSLVNLGLNTLLFHIFVDYLHVWYILAQMITSGIIAVGSFFVYKYFIFKHHA